MIRTGRGSRVSSPVPAAAAVLLSLLLANCGGGGGDGGGGGGGGGGVIIDACDNPGGPCAAPEPGYAGVCDLGEDGTLKCVNVCADDRGFREDGQAIGEDCELDIDCEGDAVCDNDVLGPETTCRCVAESTCDADFQKIAFYSPAIGPACSSAEYAFDRSAQPGTFDVKRTCRRVDGACTETREEISIGRNWENYEDFCWTSDDGGFRTGQMCGQAFSFVESPASGEYETGLFLFSTNKDFSATWIVYAHPGGPVVARCRGNGTQDQMDVPPDPPGCDDYYPFGR